MEHEEEYPRVKFIRLDNGDDLISEVVEVGDDETISYHLINPLKVAYVPSEKTGYIHIAFMPWVFPKMVDVQEFTLQYERVVIISDVSERMNHHYWNSVEEYLNYSKTTESQPIEEPEEDQSEVEELNDVLQTLAQQRRTYH